MTVPPVPVDFLPAGNAAVFQGAPGNPNFVILNRFAGDGGNPVGIDGTITGRVSATDPTTAGLVVYSALGGFVVGSTASFAVRELRFDNVGAFNSDGSTVRPDGSPVGDGSLSPVMPVTWSGMLNAGSGPGFSGLYLSYADFTASAGSLNGTGDTQIGLYDSTFRLGGTTLTIPNITMARSVFSYEGGATNATRTLSQVFILTENETIRVTDDRVLTLSGAVGGAGSLASTGSGTLVLTGTNTYAGGTSIASGNTFQLGAGGPTGSIVGNVANDGTLAFNRSNPLTFSGAISGSGGVRQMGAGQTTLSAANTYGGGTIVDAGILEVAAGGSVLGTTLVNGGLFLVNGTAAGVTVGAGGTLGGNGTVGATTVNGTLAPGNSIGTLTVAGDLNYAAGSTYALEVSPTVADRTNVIGQATLSGGTVVVTYLPGTFVTSNYIILNATAGLGGTQFAGLTGATLPGLTSALRYDANNVYLDLALVPVVPPTGPPVVPPADPIMPSDLPQNQENAVNTILGYFAANGGLPAEFLTLNANTLPQVTGEIGTSAITAGLQSADGFLNLLGDPRNGARVQTATGSEPLAFGEVNASGGTATQTVSKMAGYPMGDTSTVYGSGWTVWGGVYGGSFETEGDAGVGSSDTDADTVGLAGGIEHVFGNGAIGLALGGGTSSFGLDNGLGHGDERSFNAGLYANQDFGNAYAVAALGYGYHDVDTSRFALGNLYGAGFDAHSWSGRIEGGYRIDTPVVAISPYAAAQAINYRLPGYSETGPSVFGLSYDRQSTTATRIELGARFEHAVAMDSNTVLRLTGRAAWAINGNTERRVQASFQSLPGTSFTVDGAEPDRNAALIDAGAEFDFGNGLTAGASFQGEFSGNVESYGGKAKLSMKW